VPGTSGMYENCEINLFLLFWYVSLTPCLSRKKLCVLQNGLKQFVLLSGVRGGFSLGAFVLFLG